MTRLILIVTFAFLFLGCTQVNKNLTIHVCGKHPAAGANGGIVKVNATWTSTTPIRDNTIDTDADLNIEGIPLN